MNDIPHKLHVLARIAHRFNERGLCWAIGASLLLYLKGIVADFHDIDLMVHMDDIDEAESLLRAMGTLEPQNPNARYETKRFLEFNVEGVEVDVLGGFAIVSEGKVYDCSLKQSQIAEIILLDGERIPLHNLEDWRTYYALMGRSAKVQRIDDALRI